MPGAARLAAVARHLGPTRCSGLSPSTAAARPQTPSSAPRPAPAAETAAEQPAAAPSIDAAVEQIQTEGFYVWPGFIGGARLAQLSEDCDRLLHPIENQPGLDGEPMSSRMKKQLLPDTRCMDDLFLDPTLHAIVGGVFAGRGFRIGLTQSMIKDVLRGEDIRSMHQDDGIYMWRDGLARPHEQPIVINSLLAVDPFTLQSGATRVVRRSHLWSEPLAKELIEQREGDFYETVQMAPGSIVLFDGGVYHGRGPNYSAPCRRALNLYFEAADAPDYYAGLRMKGPPAENARVPHELSRVFES